MRILDFSDRSRTLEEVAKLLNLSLEIKLLRGDKYMWHVKLERLRIYDVNPLKMKYVICRSDNPNFAMTKLCLKISHRTVVAPQIGKENKVVMLGEVLKGPLYLRLCEGL